MTDAEILEMVKFNLAIAGTAWDTYLVNLIGAAKQLIAREGITLDMSSVEDCNLVVMYTAYLYRKRAESSVQGNLSWVAGMPRMLRYALNNRLFAEKISENTDTSGGA